MIHILQTVKELTDQGITLVSTTDGIDSSAPAGRMMIGVAVALAKDPDDRFARCADFARALAEQSSAHGSPSPVAATKTGPPSAGVGT
jgi:DNA invertase Pin-like site-specific DNA recombinase